MTFLQSAAIDQNALGTGALMAFIGAFLVFALVIIIVFYLFSSFAYMAIAKKGKYPSPGIAWIPGIGPVIITWKLSKMHWWPFLLIIWEFIPFIGAAFSLAFGVFSIIWHWKTFEAIGKPNWWAILLIIPVVNIIILGIAAWSK